MDISETIIFDSNEKPATKTTEKSTERSRIIMVVDETGSMHRHKPVTISSYNEWLDSNRTKEEDEDHFPKFSMVKFNTVTKLQEFDSVESAPRLSEYDYNPSNMTALYDALGETMMNYESESDNIMVILTDGEENSSRKWTQKMIQEKIKYFTEEKGWIFHYLGANQDAWAVGSSIGITDKKFTSTYSADDGGFQHCFAENSKQTRNYRGHQARKKKGMFTPSLNEMVVPTLDKKSYLENRAKNLTTQNIPVQAQNQIQTPFQNQSVDTKFERVLFNSGGSSLFGNTSNVQQKPTMKKKMRSRPMFSQNIIRQQQAPQNDQIQQVIQESQQNQVQIQQDFDTLFQNSDKDMQEALKNSLTDNY